MGDTGVATYLEAMRRKMPQAKEELSPGALEMHLAEAVRHYSRYAPRLRVRDYVGDGAIFDFTLPADWAPEFSRIRQVEYPLGEKKPQLLETDDYLLYLGAQGYVLRLLDVPADGKTVRIAYTIPHSLNLQEDTIPSSHRRPVVCLAAALVAHNLAAKYAGFTDPSLAADVINYRTKQREYTDIARQLEACFYTFFGVATGRGADSLAPAAAGWTKFTYSLDTRLGVSLP